jgi:hypothetical protein
LALDGLHEVMAVALDSIARYAPLLPTALAATGTDSHQIAPWLPRLLAAWQSDSFSEVERVLAQGEHALTSLNRDLLQTALGNYDFRAGEAATEVLIIALAANMKETLCP